MEEINGVAFWPCQKSISRSVAYMHIWNKWFPDQKDNYAQLVVTTQ